MKLTPDHISFWVLVSPFLVAGAYLTSSWPLGVVAMISVSGLIVVTLVKVVQWFRMQSRIDSQIYDEVKRIHAEVSSLPFDEARSLVFGLVDGGEVEAELTDQPPQFESAHPDVRDLLETVVRIELGGYWIGREYVSEVDGLIRGTMVGITDDAHGHVVVRPDGETLVVYDGEPDVSPHASLYHCLMAAWMEDQV